MLTEDYRPGVEGRLSSKTTCFPGKTSRMTWDRGRVSCERLKIIVTAINVSMVLALAYCFKVRTLRNVTVCICSLQPAKYISPIHIRSKQFY